MVDITFLLTFSLLLPAFAIEKKSASVIRAPADIYSLKGTKKEKHLLELSQSVECLLHYNHFNWLAACHSKAGILSQSNKTFLLIPIAVVG